MTNINIYKYDLEPNHKLLRKIHYFIALKYLNEKKTKQKTVFLWYSYSIVSYNNSDDNLEMNT